MESADFGAQLNYSQVYKHDYINYYTKVAPLPVDYNNVVWRERINKYYEAWDFHRHDLIEDLLLFLEDILLGDKFMFANERYYWLQEMHHPYFKNVYDYQCLPGQNCSAFTSSSSSSSAASLRRQQQQQQRQLRQ